MPRTSPSSSASTATSTNPSWASGCRQQVGLVTAQLEQQPTTVTEIARAPGDYPAQHVGAVLAAVVGERRLERERVALQYRQVGRRNVGHHGRDHVHAPIQPGRQRREQVAAIGLDAVCLRAGDRAVVHVGCHHPSIRSVADERAGDRSGSGAEVDRRTGGGQAGDGPQREWLALAAGHVHARIDPDLFPAEVGVASDPGERLPGQPATYQ